MSPGMLRLSSLIPASHTMAGLTWTEGAGRPSHQQPGLSCPSKPRFMQVAYVSANKATALSFPGRTHPHANSHSLSSSQSHNLHPHLPRSQRGGQAPCPLGLAVLRPPLPAPPPSVSTPKAKLGLGRLSLHSDSGLTVNVPASQVSREGVFPLLAFGHECGPQSVCAQPFVWTEISCTQPPSPTASPRCGGPLGELLPI